MVALVVAGDIGAGANIVRNLMLLSEDTHWILLDPRLERIQQQYPLSLAVQRDRWLEIESSFRYCDSYYGIDISQDIDLDQFDSIDWMQYPSHPILLNHSFVWQIEKFKALQAKNKALVVMPISQLGFEWQIRAYTEKKGAELLHNFTFSSDVEQQKTEFIATHGVKKWCELNIVNMREIITGRGKNCRSTLDSHDVLALESLIYRDYDVVWKKLCDHFDIEIPKKELVQILDLWNDLHWPVTSTMDWEFGIGI